MATCTRREASFRPTDGADRGHFLTFRTARAAEVHRALLDRDVVTDYRADRLRFGFGLYHDPEDVDQLCRQLAGLESRAKV